MIKASLVADELRRIADALAAKGDLDITRPMLSFYCYEKLEFFGLAKALPRPLAKVDDVTKLILENRSEGVLLRALIDKRETCTLITPAKPAVYDCQPFLSMDEEAELEADHD